MTVDRTTKANFERLLGATHPDKSSAPNVLVMGMGTLGRMVAADLTRRWKNVFVWCRGEEDDPSVIPETHQAFYRDMIDHIGVLRTGILQNIGSIQRSALPGPENNPDFLNFPPEHAKAFCLAYRDTEAHYSVLFSDRQLLQMAMPHMDVVVMVFGKSEIDEFVAKKMHGEAQDVDATISREKRFLQNLEIFSQYPELALTNDKAIKLMLTNPEHLLMPGIMEMTGTHPHRIAACGMAVDTARAYASISDAMGISSSFLHNMMMFGAHGAAIPYFGEMFGLVREGSLYSKDKADFTASPMPFSEIYEGWWHASETRNPSMTAAQGEQELYDFLRGRIASSPFETFLQHNRNIFKGMEGLIPILQDNPENVAALAALTKGAMQSTTMGPYGSITAVIDRATLDGKKHPLAYQNGTFNLHRHAQLGIMLSEDAINTPGFFGALDGAVLGMPCLVDANEHGIMPCVLGKNMKAMDWSHVFDRLPEADQRAQVEMAEEQKDLVRGSEARAIIEGGQQRARILKLGQSRGAVQSV